MKSWKRLQLRFRLMPIWLQWVAKQRTAIFNKTSVMSTILWIYHQISVIQNHICVWSCTRPVGTVGGSGSDRGWHEKPAAPHNDSELALPNLFAQQRSRRWPNAAAAPRSSLPPGTRAHNCVGFCFVFFIFASRMKKHMNPLLWYIETL